MEVDALLDTVVYNPMDAREHISNREECRAGRRESPIVIYVTGASFQQVHFSSNFVCLTHILLMWILLHMKGGLGFRQLCIC